MIGQLNNHKVNYLHNLQKNNNGYYITVTVTGTVNKYDQQKQQKKNSYILWQVNRRAKSPAFLA